MTNRATRRLAGALSVCALAAGAARPAPAVQGPERQGPSPHFFRLAPSPQTVAWGYYDAATPPVLRVASGDTVEARTLITSSPTRLEGAGVAPDQVEQALRDITAQVTNKGPGGHILTGPIYVEGALPGVVPQFEVDQRPPER